MNSWCKILLIFLLSINILSAQSSKVSGVISGDGNLENATIHILEISQFFSSDKKGNYSFIISESGNYTIQFSHLGYKTETRKLLVENGKAYILNIELSQKPINIGEAVVISSRNENLLKEVSLPIELIDQQKIENSTLLSVSDLVSKNAGITLINDSPWGTTINIRGLSKQNIVYLIDGDRIETSTNIAAGLSMLDLNNIASIEVVKGGISSLYGSGATGGVINVKTKETYYRNSFFLLPTISSSINSVNNSSSNYLNLISGGVNWSASLSGSYRNAGDTQTPKGKLENSAFQDESFNAGLKYNPIENIELKLSYDKFSAYNVGIPGGDPFPASAVAKYKYAKRELLSGELSITNALKSLAKLKLKYYHQIIDRNVEIMPNPMVTSNPQAEHINDGLTIQSDWIFNNKNYFNAGIDYWQRKYEGLRTTNNKAQNIIKVDKPVPNSKFGSLGFFAQNEAKLVDQKLSLTIGGRYDLINISNEETKNPVYIINNGVKNTNVVDAAASYVTGKETNKSFSGNLGILYKLTNEIDLTLNTAYTFRSPSLEERYQFIDLGGIVYLGNPNLKPEKGVSFDYGIRIWKEKFSVRANAFLNSLTDLVVDDIVTQDSLYKKNNVGKARLYGFDLSAEYNFINDNLFYLTAAFVRGEDLNKNENLSEIPPLNGIFGLRLFLFNEIKLDVSANMFSSQTKVAANESKTGGYTTFDLSLQSNSINYFGAKFKLVTGIENIFDRAYRNHLSTYRGLNLLEPGRNIFAKIIIDFR